jgi:cbb3-type cytochrome oxidase maturation protein
MSGSIIAMMIGVSLFLGTIALLALLWGLKTGQFDDQNKFINAAQFDGEDELRDAAMMEKRAKEAKEKKEKREKGYRPPD